MIRQVIILASVAAGVPVSAQNLFAPNQYRPVLVGTNGPDLDACGSNGRVYKLNPKGDNFLAVKAAPNLKAPRIDKLFSRNEVYVCDGSQDGKWLGVVYHTSRKSGQACGVTSPVPRARAYAGPCKSGWVAADYVDIYAG